MGSDALYHRSACLQTTVGLLPSDWRGKARFVKRRPMMDLSRAFSPFRHSKHLAADSTIPAESAHLARCTSTDLGGVQHPTGQLSTIERDGCARRARTRTSHPQIPNHTRPEQYSIFVSELDPSATPSILVSLLAGNRYRHCRPNVSGRI